MNEILYKFLPIERLSYLDNQLLRFTPPGDLNDPFECIPILPTKDEVISIIETIAKENLATIENEKLSKKDKKKIKTDYIRKYKSEITAVKKDLPNNFNEQFYDRAVKQLNNKLGIFSLSRRWNSTLMCAHYTNSHKGFCVGFNKNSSFFKLKGNPIDPTFFIQPVEYSENRIKVPVERGMKIDPRVILTKSNDWKYEEEERLIGLLELSNKKIDAKPFDIHLFKIPHKIISEIIVGANISKDNFEIINKFCLDNKISLYKSVMSATKFDMIREQII